MFIIDSSVLSFKLSYFNSNSIFAFCCSSKVLSLNSCNSAFIDSLADSTVSSMFNLKSVSINFTSLFKVSYLDSKSFFNNSFCSIISFSTLFILMSTCFSNFCVVSLILSLTSLSFCSIFSLSSITFCSILLFNSSHFVSKFFCCSKFFSFNFCSFSSISSFVDFSVSSILSLNSDSNLFTLLSKDSYFVSISFSNCSCFSVVFSTNSTIFSSIFSLNSSVESFTSSFNF